MWTFPLLLFFCIASEKLGEKVCVCENWKVAQTSTFTAANVDVCATAHKSALVWAVIKRANKLKPNSAKQKSQLSAKNVV